MTWTTGLGAAGTVHVAVESRLVQERPRRASRAIGNWQVGCSDIDIASIMTRGQNAADAVRGQVRQKCIMRVGVCVCVCACVCVCVHAWASER